MPHWTQTAAGRKRMAEIQRHRKEQKDLEKEVAHKVGHANAALRLEMDKSTNENLIQLATKEEIIRILLHHLEGEIKLKEEIRQNLLKELGENG